ncbi:MAG: DASH family cryptochrome [Cyclobacteriaceae bacterium]|nr:DASH family cryptochrome [Cyclobacteriaceae bacterium HetDA_MAG_MS6]
MSRALVWFRNDLRVKDNAVLRHATENFDEVLTIFCFDEAAFRQTVLGHPKTGSFKAKFLLESVKDLRSQIKRIGGQLIIRLGKPEEIIPWLAELLQVQKVLVSKEAAPEEVHQEKMVERALWRTGIELQTIWQHTLYHIDDLPFPIQRLPDVFTQFRKRVEKESQVRATVDMNISLKATTSVDPGDLPSWQSLGLSEPSYHPKAVLTFTGGEQAVWDRVNHYFFKTRSLSEYKETRNGLLGADYSSKLSPWLALGCISPRSVYFEVKKYEREIIKNSSTYWLVFELIWRDYFRFVGCKYGAALFRRSGIKRVTGDYPGSVEDFHKWTKGETGEPFVDANMKELNATGFMSNRGRQNVASYLVKDLKVDWTLGASYFESLLLDYDPCSNWGNWAYVAGVGNDPRENRHFNVPNQAERYDADGAYRSQWLGGR